MAAKNFMLAQQIDAKTAYEYLKDNMRSPKISSITYDEAMQRVNVEGNYYTYQLSFIGNQLSITQKTVQKWLIIMIACILSGFILLVPFAGMVVLAVLMNMEAKEIATLITQTLNMMPKP